MIDPAQLFHFPGQVTYEALKIHLYRIVVLCLIPRGFCMFGSEAKNISRGLTRANPVREGTKGGYGEDRRGTKAMRFGRNHPK